MYHSDVWPPYLFRTVGKNEKLESFKLESLKLESFFLSWKEPSEVGKFLLKLESFAEVGKCHCTLYKVVKSDQKQFFVLNPNWTVICIQNDGERYFKPMLTVRMNRTVKVEIQNFKRESERSKNRVKSKVDGG